MLPSQLRALICRCLVLAAALAAAATPAVGQIAPPADPDTKPGDPDSGRPVVLRFLTDDDYPPFNYLDDEGVLAGFNVDLARAICLEANATCDIRTRAWDKLLPALARGEADAVIASHAVTPRTLAQVDVSDRYFHTPGRFATRQGAPKLEMTPDGLEGRRIAVARATAHEAYLAAFFRNSAIQRFENVELARDALIAGSVDALFDDGIGLVFWLKGEASKGCCELRGGPFLEPRYFGDGIAIALPKDNARIKTLINTALRRVRASGRLEEIALRYFPERVY
jgi:polar amino acid transport system substrate-binding protein